MASSKSTQGPLITRTETEFLNVPLLVPQGRLKYKTSVILPSKTLLVVCLDTLLMKTIEIKRYHHLKGQRSFYLDGYHQFGPLFAWYALNFHCIREITEKCLLKWRTTPGLLGFLWFLFITLSRILISNYI